MERKNIVSSKGNPLTLVGPELKPGDKAPDFSVIDGSSSPVTLASSKGKFRFFSIVPSLDTGLCSTQTQTFSKRLADFGDKAALYTVSVDLPFAQGRFCSAHNIENIKFLSDHREVSFGTNYGLLMKETRLLARSVVIVDKNDRISYIQIVPEVGKEPNYDDALDALKRALA